MSDADEQHFDELISRTHRQERTSRIRTVAISSGAIGFAAVVFLVCALVLINASSTPQLAKQILADETQGLKHSVQQLTDQAEKAARSVNSPEIQTAMAQAERLESDLQLRVAEAKTFSESPQFDELKRTVEETQQDHFQRSVAQATQAVKTLARQDVRQQVAELRAEREKIQNMFAELQRTADEQRGELTALQTKTAKAQTTLDSLIEQINESRESLIEAKLQAEVAKREALRQAIFQFGQPGYRPSR